MVNLLGQGIRAEELGDLEGAIALFGGASRSPDPALAAEALTRLADARRSRSEWADALAAARRAQEIARISELEPLEHHAMVAEANILLCRGEFRDARGLFEQVLTRSSDLRTRGLALQNIGSILAQQGDLGAAERCFAESYGYFQQANYRRGEATALNNYGRVTFDRGNVKLAEDLLRQAVSVARDAGHGELIALTTHNLAEVLAKRGDVARAEDLAHEALGFFAGSGNRWREIECLRLIGTINEQRGERDNAARCYERGLELANQVGATFESQSIGECLRRLRSRVVN
jgi:tetratricopeptide (TPR) repeat protein